MTRMRFVFAIRYYRHGFFTKSQGHFRHTLLCDGELCGYAQDFCCAGGQVRVTDEADIADCRPATAVAGQGARLTSGTTTNLRIVGVPVTKVGTPSSSIGSPAAIIGKPMIELRISTSTSTSARSEETYL